MNFYQIRLRKGNNRSFVRRFQAKNMKNAKRQAKRKYPNCKIISAYVLGMW